MWLIPGFLEGLIKFDLGGVAADGSKLRSHVGVLIGRVYIGFYLSGWWLRAGVWFRFARVTGSRYFRIGPLFLAVTDAHFGKRVHQKGV